MKILLINTNDIYGGAARAAYRLHLSLLNSGINSTYLVKNKIGYDNNTISISGNKFKYKTKIINLLNKKLLRKYKNKEGLFSVDYYSTGLDKIINKMDIDLVHLHWISGFLDIKSIGKINKPIVWTLHDMWPFTGGCHYDNNCGKYKNNCGNCPLLSSPKENDLSNKVIKIKQKTFSNIPNITINGVSRWMERSAKKSSIFKEKSVVNLPNPIDTNIFMPFDKVKSRELWNLPLNKKLVLFGAMGATSDLRKGFEVLIQALQKLKEKNIDFVVFGSTEPQEIQNFEFKAHYVGSLADDVSLVTLYSAVDVMIAPSLEENLSNAIMESLSCATPVVAFDIGGNRDMIENKKTGYLARPFDTTGLANGIEWILKAKNYNELCNNAREKILQQFDSKIVAAKYIELYSHILEKTGKNAK